MTMQFHTFLSSQIHTFLCKIRNLHHSTNRANRNFMTIVIHRSHTMHFDEIARRKVWNQFFLLFSPNENLNLNGIRLIRNIKHENRFRAFLEFFIFKIKNLTTDDDIAHLTLNLLDWYDITLDVTTIKHIRIARSLQRSTSIETFLLAESILRSFPSRILRFLIRVLRL